MQPGAFTDDIDLIQVLLVAFALFFAGLVIYLRREDKREGYPLVSSLRHAVIGWPAPPPTKVFRLMGGGTAVMPHEKPQVPLDNVPPSRFGQPLRVVGGRMFSGLGAGAYVLRSEEPMRTPHGDLLLEPLRNVEDWSVAHGEVDMRGMRVFSRDHLPVGTVVDLWIDRVARILRYLEVDLGEGGTVLLPIFHGVVVEREREIRVKALKAEHFPHVPRLADPNQMTTNEEDRLNAFYAGGTIYADAYPA